MKCPTCDTENPGGAKFCQNCGRPLMRACSECGTSNAPVARFCTNCGTSLEEISDPERETKLKALQESAPPGLQEKMRASRSQIEGERKPVTILFADIVGSTAMAEKLDPEEWKEIVSGAHRRVGEAIYRYEGTIAQLLGDGVLAFFGAPITHEDDPVRAVRAALDLQEAISKYRFELAGLIEDFQMRIGINTGTVVIGEIGTDMHVEYLAIGDAVNIAARLQSAAQPGKVLLSETSARLVQDDFELKSLGDIQVKGRAEPLAVYEVVEARIKAAVKRGIESFITPYVGRAREVEKLQSALSSLCEGHGQIVTVMGEAGIGKTRLLEEVRVHFCEGEDDLETTSAPPSSLRWLEGRSLSYGSSLSYWVIMQLLLADLGLSDGSPQVKIKVALRQRVNHLFGDEAPADILPFLNHLLGLEESDDKEHIQFLDGGTLKLEILRSVRTYFEQVAKEDTTVLVFEDMHWADPSSLEALENVFALTDRVPLMILMLMRIERDHGSWGTKIRAETDFPHRYTEIHLRRLSEGDSRQLVDHLLGPGDLPEEVEQEIRARSEGNPFYLEEIVHHLMEEGLIIRDDGRWKATEGIHEFGIPETLHGILLARIDRLDEEVRRTLQMASVIGKSFLYRILESISEAEQQLDEHLSHLQRADLVREKARIPELEYHFKHTLTQEATYNSLLHERRKEFHRKVGEALEGLFPDRVDDFLGLLAYHFEIAEAYEKALDYLSRAERRANFDRAIPEALDYQKRVLRICEELGDPLKIGSAEVWLGWHYWGLGDRKASLEHLHHALDVLEGEGETMELALALSQISRISMVASDYDQGIIWGERALKLAEKFGDEGVMIATLNTVGVCRLHRGEEDSGLGALRESLHRSLELNYQFEVTRAYYNLGECLGLLSRHEEARFLYEEYLEYTQQFASRTNEQIAMTQLIHLDWRCGRWGEAICNRAFIKKLPVGIFRIWAKTAEGWMENDLGRPEETLGLMEGLLDDVLDTGEIQTIAPFLGQLARAYAAMEMERETKDTLHLFLEHFNRIGRFDWYSTMPLLFACRWFASRSDAKSLEASRECAARLAEGSDLHHMPMVGAAIAEARGLIALSEKVGVQAVDCFRDAARRWETLGQPYDQTRALEGLGRAHALAKDMDAAIVAYNQAYELIQTLADQLEDGELRGSFMASQLVEGIRQGKMALGLSSN